MSEPSSVGPEKITPPKKPISPARNIIGLVVLAVVLAVCWFEYSAVLGFNAAVKALDTRTTNEEQGLATVAEAETLLGKQADGPAENYSEGSFNFDKKTYTWKGLLKQHTLTAYYTKEKDARLHHFETEGQKYDMKANQVVNTIEPGGGISAPKGGRGGGGGGGGGNRGGGGAAKSKPSSTSPTAINQASDKDKSAAPKAEPGDKDKSAAPKAEPSDKDKSAPPSDKASTPKTEPSAGAAAKEKTSEPSPKSEPPK